MKYWLIKSDPDTYSWDDQVKAGIEPWDGVRNFQARNFMKEMKVGDIALFYRSIVKPAVEGVVEIVKEHYPDPKDERFVVVDVKTLYKLKSDVLLSDIKQHPDLQNLLLLKQSRLSVMPITKEEFEIISNLGGGN